MKSQATSEYALGPPVAPLPRGARPRKQPLAGERVRLEPIEAARHAVALFASSRDGDPEGRLWIYMPYGPFADFAAFEIWCGERARSDDPLFYAIVDKTTGEARGMASYLRITPEMGAIEIGHIWFAPSLQRTRQATEAVYLLARHVFEDLRYRRLEWKCDALNDTSRRAAVRFGFTFEGIFRQHMVVKGRNRDTAWYALLDHEWPRVRANFEPWLAPENFDHAGRQKLALSALNAPRA